MKIKPDCIVNIPELECPQCGSHCFLEKAETRRFNGPFCINFCFRCRGCNMGMLLKANKEIREETHQMMKREMFDVIINPNHETHAVNGYPVSEIDCKISWVANGEEIDYA